MAHISLWVNTNDIPQVSSNPVNSSSSPININQGDTVEFRYFQNLSTNNPDETISFQSFPANIFTSIAGGYSFTALAEIQSTTPQTFVPHTSGGFTVSSTATLGATTVTAKNLTRGAANTIYLNVTGTAPVDITPDAFSLGVDITNAHPTEIQYSEIVHVLGINAQVNVSVAGSGAAIQKNYNGSWVTSTTALINDSFIVRVPAPLNYGLSTTVTLTIGNMSDVWVVSTPLVPPVIEILDSTITSLPVSLNAVKNYFGGFANVYNVPSTNNLLAYVRGGAFVPDISQNSAINTTVPLSLKSFLNSKTSFFIDTLPSTKALVQNVLTTGGTFQLVWSVPTDWSLGFGANMFSQAEYKFVLTENISANTVTGIIATTSTASISTYSTSNTMITLTTPVIPSAVEKMYTGHIDFYARSIVSPYPILTTTAYYRFNFYGI